MSPGVEQLEAGQVRNVKRISSKEIVESVCHVASGSPPKPTPLNYVKPRKLAAGEGGGAGPVQLKVPTEFRRNSDGSSSEDNSTRSSKVKSGKEGAFSPAPRQRKPSRGTKMSHSPCASPNHSQRQRPHTLSVDNSPVNSPGQSPVPSPSHKPHTLRVHHSPGHPASPSHSHRPSSLRVDCSSGQSPGQSPVPSPSHKSSNVPKVEYTRGHTRGHSSGQSPGHNLLPPQRRATVGTCSAEKSPLVRARKTFNQRNAANDDDQESRASSNSNLSLPHSGSQDFHEYHFDPVKVTNLDIDTGSYLPDPDHLEFLRKALSASPNPFAKEEIRERSSSLSGNSK